MVSGLFPAPVQPGDVLRGKYRVERLLGQGGMAYVVAAWHLHLEQRVAIKLLRPETVEHPEVIERFQREARAASRLESVHVARVIDVDVLDGGLPFMVLEYLEGQDLAHVLKDRAPLPVSDVVHWLQEASLGIAEAHALGVIHRDVKPANLFLAQKRSGETVIKVLDFGISKLLEDTRITQTSVGMGSAEYMSPEQMRSAGDVDRRTDVWSLGVTLYELLTGQTPFHAEGVGQVATAVLTADPVPPRRLRPDVPAGLEAVILRCLDKDPERRFASANDLAVALAAFTSVPSFPDGIPSSRAAPPSRVSGPPSLSGPRSTPAPASPSGPPSVSGPLSGPPSTSVYAPLASLPTPAAPTPRASPAAIIAGGAVAALAVVVVVVAFAVGRGGGSRGAVAPLAAGDGARFVINGDTVRDTQTRLTWQRTPAAGAVDWASAKAFCAHQVGGYRLPEIDELEGLLALTEASPPVDPAGFPTTPVDVFWSASSAGSGAASVIHFSTGKRGTSVVSGRNRARCVK